MRKIRINDDNEYNITEDDNWEELKAKVIQHVGKWPPMESLICLADYEDASPLNYLYRREAILLSPDKKCYMYSEINFEGKSLENEGHFIKMFQYEIKDWMSDMGMADEYYQIFGDQPITDEDQMFHYESEWR